MLNVSDKPAPGVSIVVPSWNGIELLKRFLPSVLASAGRYSEQTRAPVEIIIVNDGSTDGTAEYLLGLGFETEPRTSQPHGLRLINNEANIGFGRTCNRGFQAARYPLVFLLNNDVEVSEGAIAPLVENFSDPARFAAHCRVFEVEDGAEVGTGKIGSFARGFIRVHRSYVTKHAKEPGSREPDDDEPLYSIFATGGSSMFDRQKFIGLGAFDELLSPIYWEDVDISYRAWKRGYTISYEPRSVVRHRVSSTMRRVGRKKIWRLKQRNRLIYHWVNLHDPGLMASHLLWVALLAVTAPLRLQPGFILALIDALRRLGPIRRRRREERLAARRTDREVFEVFDALSRRADVQVYDDRRELERLTRRAQQG
ncbi:MAG TPA: glycosyltransferase family 2 protein [Blastocatellia bacterium]|nr:glycosyltransferase family 2 protein [Blastocatellia bacterium]